MTQAPATGSSVLREPLASIWTGGEPAPLPWSSGPRGVVGCCLCTGSISQTFLDGKIGGLFLSTSVAGTRDWLRPAAAAQAINLMPLPLVLGGAHSLCIWTRVDCGRRDCSVLRQRSESTMPQGCRFWGQSWGRALFFLSWFLCGAGFHCKLVWPRFLICLLLVPFLHGSSGLVTGAVLCFSLSQDARCCFTRPTGRIPWIRAAPRGVPCWQKTASCSLSRNIPRRKMSSASATPLGMSTCSRYCWAF